MSLVKDIKEKYLNIRDFFRYTSSKHIKQVLASVDRSIIESEKIHKQSERQHRQDMIYLKKAEENNKKAEEDITCLENKVLDIDKNYRFA